MDVGCMLRLGDVALLFASVWGECGVFDYYITRTFLTGTFFYRWAGVQKNR
jgi:hypothetical protein